MYCIYININNNFITVSMTSEIEINKNLIYSIIFNLVLCLIYTTIHNSRKQSMIKMAVR